MRWTLLLSTLLTYCGLSRTVASAVTVTQKSRHPSSRNAFKYRGGASHHHEDCGRPKIPTNRRACGFYIWDAPSALLYKWCHYLLKDHIYEGRGGYLFVRFESNSILQLLYPCSRYSPNKCMLCGGSYPDHLELWWGKHLYTPFDKNLDKSYQDAMITPKSESVMTKTPRSQGTASARRKSINQGPTRSTMAQQVEAPKFGFHQRYVRDVTEAVTASSDQQEQFKMLRKLLGNGSNNSSKKAYRLTKMLNSGVAYVVPVPRREDNKAFSVKQTLQKFMTYTVLRCLDDLILLQGVENKRNASKAMK